MNYIRDMIQRIYIIVNNTYIIIIILTKQKIKVYTTKNKPKHTQTEKEIYSYSRRIKLPTSGTDGAQNKHTQTEMEIVTQGASSFPPVELMELRINTHKRKWK